MCGINGLINFNATKPSLKALERMNDCISYRGPDDAGVYIDRGVGFGHRRLSIIDLSKAGHQPMTYTHGNRTVVLTYNGEIYNFKEIKEELLNKNYAFKSKTDSEVILASYLEWGVECLKKFNGMFAFVLYDKDKNILFGARDRFGKKPLKYYHDDDRFIFSSELKAILTQDVKREPDFTAIDDYLTLQYVPSPKTGFKGIYKLSPSHYFILNLTTRLLDVKRYWDLEYSQKLNISESQWLKLLENQLEQSVKKRLISDVPIGAFLSGGVDSSAIVAFMSKFTDKVKTFSIGFDEKDYDETKYARKVAKRYNTDHKEFTVKVNDMLKLIEKLVYQYEEPYADSSQLPTYMLAEFTRKHVTVALNGDGGDENFGGYDKYEKHLIAKRIFIPFNRTLASFFDFLDKNIKSSLFFHKVFLFLRTLRQPNWLRHLNYTHYFDTYTKNEFYKPEFKRKLGTHSSFFCFSDLMKRKKNVSYMDRIFYLDFNTYVPDDLMVKVDIASMANSLESRSPLLDHEFVSLAAKMPSTLKIRFGERKYIFKKMLEKYLDKDILVRRKKGFGVPIEHWFRKELKDYIRDNLLNKQGIVLNIMKIDKVKRLLTDHFRGKDNSKKLWTLMILNLWHERFFGGVKDG
ncbi:MAG: asparagine synthase (glutamine-hydrolyzing) [archaeon]